MLRRQRSSRIVETLARTVLRLLALAGLLAMLPPLPALPRAEVRAPSARAAAAASFRSEPGCRAPDQCEVGAAGSRWASR